MEGFWGVAELIGGTDSKGRKCGTLAARTTEGPTAGANCSDLPSPHRIMETQGH